MTDKQHLHVLGVFIHGVLFGLHVVGVAYNVKKRNWWDSSVHGLVALYDLSALRKHQGECASQKGLMDVV